MLVRILATYNLEGDGALVLQCYEEITKIRAALHAGHYPNMFAIARRLAPGNLHLQQQWIQYGMSCVKDGIKYFQDKLGNDSAPPLNALRGYFLLLKSVTFSHQFLTSIC